MHSTTPLSADAKLVHAIFRMQILMATRIERLFTERKNLELTFSQFLILSIIDCPQDEAYCVHPSQSTIARELSISAPAVSRHIDNLIVLDYIECVVDPDNKRRHMLALTKNGRRVLGRARKILDAELETLFGHMSVQARATIVQQLSQCIKTLENAR